MHINLISSVLTWRVAEVTWPLFCRLKSLVSSMYAWPCIWPLLLLNAEAYYVLLQVVRRQVTWLLIFGYFLCVFVWSHLTPVRQVIMDVFAMFVALSGSAVAAYAKFKCGHLTASYYHLTLHCTLNSLCSLYRTCSLELGRHVVGRVTWRLIIFTWQV